MFQSFKVISDHSQSANRINELRKLLKQHKLDGYIVPLSDEHQGEYIAEYAQRLKWLTGFSGSAGMALILLDKAVFFTDGRYSLQVRTQTDSNIFSYEDFTETPISKYLEENLQHAKIAIDPALFTIAQAKALRHSLKNTDSELIYPPQNLVDAIWHDQPAEPLSKITIHELKYSGIEAEQKIKQIQTIMLKNQYDNLVLCDATSIAWLFNIRGQDVEHTPVSLAFACVSATELPTLFIKEAKLTSESSRYLKDICQIKEPNSFIDFLKNKARDNETFGLDFNTCSEQIYNAINYSAQNIYFIQDPIQLAKAVKNETELTGARQAHYRDGAAMVKFLCWLDEQQPGTIDEISAAKKLEEYRKKTAAELGSELKEISFDSISGAGEHGAIIHYHVTEETNKILEANSLYLIDSGAQYRGGTTDITRTIAIGDVGEEEKMCFTLVLKGLINLSMARFLPNTKGSHLDILARSPLLQHGLDYAHGTGHGIGSYLSVHEGPQAISRLNQQELLANMIVSNEPGCYKASKFGIRLENLMIVKKAEKLPHHEIVTHSFETITLCPIDRRLIKKDLLNETEINWLNNYHALVYEKLHKYLDEKTAKWLKQATMAI